ncbi:transcriptional regulator NrdR [Kiloniella sp. b19]|uniref:transcriptional regulator NrdR n=1 Tax=Kiloniella sp. GXU_MW_B19 TaxID=3141326 RepID=UPI0031DB3355
MRCPFCSSEETQVKDSRPTEDHASIRRRRQCGGCGARFTTFERVQLRELTVVKDNGQRELFDRDKVTRSMRLALQKRNVGAEKIDQVVSGIVRQLESSGEAEIPTDRIGSLVMDALMHLDKVGYIRFASVYRDFQEVSDFKDLVGRLDDRDEEGHIEEAAS